MRRPLPRHRTGAPWALGCVLRSCAARAASAATETARAIWRAPPRATECALAAGAGSRRSCARFGRPRPVLGIQSFPRAGRLRAGPLLRERSRQRSPQRQRGGVRQEVHRGRADSGAGTGFSARRRPARRRAPALAVAARRQGAAVVRDGVRAADGRAGTRAAASAEPLRRPGPRRRGVALGLPPARGRRGGGVPVPAGVATAALSAAAVRTVVPRAGGPPVVAPLAPAGPPTSCIVSPATWRRASSSSTRWPPSGPRSSSESPSSSSRARCSWPCCWPSIRCSRPPSPPSRRRARSRCGRCPGDGPRRNGRCSTRTP